MALRNFMAARGETSTSSEPERDGREGSGTARRSASSERSPRTVVPSTCVDATTELTGTLHCKETLRIDGRVKGEVSCDKMVLIGECAKVHASIVADMVQVSGEVKGNITARSKITLTRTGRVTGDLSTPGIVIEEGAKLKCRIVIGSDEKPAQQSKPVEKPRPEAKPARTAPKAAANPPA